MRSKLTVVTAAESYDLTRLETVKSELGITDTSQDANIARWIQEASRRISSHCNRVFALETVEETIVPEYKRIGEIVLKRRPVTEIITITEGTVESGTEVLVAGDWDIDGEKGIIYRINTDISSATRAYWWSDQIVIRYSAGYELLNGLPFDVEAACIAMVKMAYFAGRRDPTIKSEDVYGVVRTDFWVGGIPGSSPGGLPPDVVDMLTSYCEVELVA